MQTVPYEKMSPRSERGHVRPALVSVTLLRPGLLSLAPSLSLGRKIKNDTSRKIIIGV